MKMPPCLPDCPLRNADPNCHSTCKNYLKWRLDRDRENDIKRQENANTDYEVNAKIRMGRIRNHGKQR